MKREHQKALKQYHERCESCGKRATEGLSITFGSVTIAENKPPIWLCKEHANDFRTANDWADSVTMSIRAAKESPKSDPTSLVEHSRIQLLLFQQKSEDRKA